RRGGRPRPASEGGRSLSRALALVLLATSAPALADEAKVTVEVETVLASLKGNTIDPPTLKAMQAKMAKKVKYGSLKRLSLEKVELATGKPHTFKLSNGADASLSLEKMEKDVATVRVKVGAVDTAFDLG